MNNSLKKVILGLLILNIPLLVILGTFRLNVFNMHFYQDEFNLYEPDVDNAVEITASMLYFLQNKDAGMGSLSAFKEVEQKHLVEVRDVIHLFLMVLYVSAVLLIVLGVLLYFLDKKEFLTNLSIVLFYGGGLSAIMISLVLFSVSLNFGWLFTKFHEIFFTTTWHFPADYLLIRLFPKMFFVDVLIKVIIGAYMASLFLNIAGYFIIKKEKYLTAKRKKK